MQRKCYNLIYQLKSREVGSGIVAVNIAQTYPDLFKAIDFNNEKIPESGRIWYLHNPFFYKRFSISRRISDFIFLRENFCRTIPGKHLTNGFSYFKNYRESYHRWFPTIYQSNFERNTEYESIGYYIRDIREESNEAFVQFVQDLPNDFPIVTMGTVELIQSKLAQRKNWFHTYSSKLFWKSCSHYFYYRPATFEDPFPHTLLEAIQSNHRIISPKNPRRQFNDGIDDLLSVIEDYDCKFISGKVGPSCQQLMASYWKKFMQLLVENEFKPLDDHRISIKRKQSFGDWIHDNLDAIDR